MEPFIFTIFGVLIFTLVWGFAVMGLIDGLGPLLKRLKKQSRPVKDRFYPFYLSPKG